MRQVRRVETRLGSVEPVRVPYTCKGMRRQTKVALVRPHTHDVVSRKLLSLGDCATFETIRGVRPDDEKGQSISLPFLGANLRSSALTSCSRTAKRRIIAVQVRGKS